MAEKRRKQFYVGIIVVLSVVFVWCVFSLVQSVKLTTEKERLYEKQRKNNAKIVRDWEVNYGALQHDFDEIMKKYRVMQEEFNKVTIPQYNFTESEIYMLAQCVEAEAGDYSVAPQSQKYVTQVILNRLQSGHFPNKIKDIIYQVDELGNPQFEVAYNGMMDRKVNPETLANVYSVIVQGTDLPSYVLYFYSARYNTDNWVSRNTELYTTVQGTVFSYSKKDR